MSHSSDIKVSLVIPAFNEGRRIDKFLPILAEAIDDNGINIEVLVIDDGGLPEHAAAYRNLLSDLDRPYIHLIQHDKNQGKGAAIITGFRQGHGEWIGFVDADGASTPDMIFRLIRIALANPDIDGVLGSRIRALGGFREKRSFIRFLMGRTFAQLVRNLFHISSYDTQCGCKLFRRSGVEPFLGKLQEKGYLIDVELIAYGFKHNLNFLEIPINYYDIPNSRIKLLDPLKMFVDLFKLKKKLKSRMES